jgi:transcription elongation factor
VDFDDKLKVEKAILSKHFEEGDQVRVIRGKNIGEVGTVLNSSDDPKAKKSVLIDHSKREIEVGPESLQLISIKEFEEFSKQKLKKQN